MNDAVSTVVFDLDLTLTQFDTTAQFIRWRIRRHRWRQVAVALARVLLGPLRCMHRTRTWPLHVIVWLATLGCRRADLPLLIEQFLATVPGGSEAIFLPEGLARVRAHLAQGQRVVIATGCIETLARTLLARVDLADVPLVASRLRRRFGGLVRDVHCFAEAKPRLLAARGFAPPWAAVYTDNDADLPLLRGGNECFLISPTPQSLARIRAALPREATILDWRRAA